MLYHSGSVTSGHPVGTILGLNELSTRCSDGYCSRQVLLLRSTVYGSSINKVDMGYRKHLV